MLRRTSFGLDSLSIKTCECNYCLIVTVTRRPISDSAPSVCVAAARDMSSSMFSIREHGFAAGVTTGLGIGVLLGIVLRKSLLARMLMRGKRGKNGGASETGEFADSGSGVECKLVLVVRNDLKMGKGKAAAQCCHASVMAFQQATRKEPSLLKLWLLTGQRKVVVKTEDESSIRQVQNTARRLGLMTSVVHDAGHTQVPSGSLTVIGVGPGPADLIDEATGHLKLY